MIDNYICHYIIILIMISVLPPGHFQCPLWCPDTSSDSKNYTKTTMDAELY